MTGSQAQQETLTVLVAGHRGDRLPADRSGLRTALEKQIREIGLTAGDAVTLRILTGQADGSDRLAMEVAGALGVALHCLVPGLVPGQLPETSQVPEAVMPERVLALGAVEGDGDRCYAVRDEIGLAYADMLVAIWDGNAARGTGGGTVRLVVEAVRLRIPVIWIDTDGAVKGFKHRNFDDAKLYCLGSRGDPLESLKGSFVTLTDAMVAEEVGRALRGTVPGEVSADLSEFSRLEQKTGNMSRWPGKFSGVCERIVRAFDTRVSAKPAHGGDKAEGKGSDPTAVLLNLHRIYDSHAGEAAGYYRDSTWFLYLAAALAVFAAVAGAVGLWPMAILPAFWAITECVVLAAIMAVFCLGRWRRWQLRWLETRFMAEQLRYAEQFIRLMVFPGAMTATAWQVRKGGELSLKSALGWRLQRALKMQGIPGSATGVIASEGAAIGILKQKLQAAIDGQVQYHKKTEKRWHHLHGRMHFLAYSLFGLSMVAVFAHFWAHWPFLLIGTAAFPACVASIHGILTKLEAARLSGQSRLTVEALEEIRDAINTDAYSDDWSRWLHLRDLAHAAVAVMSDETEAWRALLQVQKIDVP